MGDRPTFSAREFEFAQLCSWLSLDYRAYVLRSKTYKTVIFKGCLIEQNPQNKNIIMLLKFSCNDLTPTDIFGWHIPWLLSMTNNSSTTICTLTPLSLLLDWRTDCTANALRLVPGHRSRIFHTTLLRANTGVASLSWESTSMSDATCVNCEFKSSQLFDYSEFCSNI